MKNQFFIYSVLLFSVLLTGCGGYQEVNNYPTEGSAESATELAADKNQEKLDYVIYSTVGKSAYDVKADKVADTQDSYPVYETQSFDLSDEDICDYVNQIFDPGSASVIIPHFLASSDYMEQRIAVLELRREQYITKGVTSPLYIEDDLKKLYDRRESDNTLASYNIPYDKVPKWIDLHDFYNQLSIDLDCRVCFVEGTIDGEYYRMEFTDYQNTIIIKLVHLQDSFGVADNFYQMTDDMHLPFDREACFLTEEDAVSKAEDFLQKYDITDYKSIAAYPVAIYGELKEDGQYPDSRKSGYICYFAREVDGKTSPFSTNIENSNSMIPTYDNLLNLPSYVDYTWCNLLETEQGSRTYKTGYEFICVSVTDYGIENFCWSNPSEVGDVKTQKAEILDFEQIDKRAQDYLRFYSNTEDYGLNYYWLPVIDRVELSMARVTDDNMHYYMVPAWYYYIASDRVEVQVESAVCVNAIDGSIIDIAHGGNTIDFD